MPNLVNLNMRFVSIDEPGARWRITADYRLTERFTAGIEYHPEIGELLPRATWFITPETADTPSVVLGFNADRLSTPEGHAVFLTFSKWIPGTPVTPFASVKYSTADEMIAFPFGVNVGIGDGVTLQGLYDGNYSHALATVGLDGVNLTFMLARMKHPGVAVSFGF